MRVAAVASNLATAEASATATDRADLTRFQARAKGSREVAAAVNPAQRTREERKKRDGMSHFFIRQSRARCSAR